MGVSTDEAGDRVLISVHVVPTPMAELVEESRVVETVMLPYRVEVDELLADGTLEVVTAAPGPPHETVWPLMTAVVHSPAALEVELGRGLESA